MPRFYKKKMVKSAPKKAYARRRLQPIGPLLATGAFVAKRVYKRRQAAKKVANANGLRNAALRREQSDNITTAKVVTIGKQKPIGFQEKVSRAVNPPLLFKRNYQFSAESISGRKGFFSMEINTMGSNDIQTDITGYKAQMRTDTTTAEAPLSGNSIFDGARFYIDKHHEKIQMINSHTRKMINE